MKKLTTEQFIEKATLKHNNKYNYNKSIYIRSHDKLTITCNIHGDFIQTATDHLSGYGCPECKRQKAISDNSSNLDEFIIKAKTVHGDMYDYSNTVYNINSKKININCPIHGEFIQYKSNHLKGHGCNQCAIDFGTFTKSKFINLSKGRPCTFYIIKCWNEIEIFYKIGITTLNIKLRYQSVRHMPYSYEIVRIIQDKADIVWDLEFNLKTNLISKYQPQIYFPGSLTECYSDLEEILSNIS